MILQEINPFVRSIKVFTLKKNLREIAYGANPRLFYFTDGKGSIQFGQTTYMVYKDVAVLYPAGLLYELYAEEPLTYLTLNFDYTQNFSHLDRALHLWREGREPMPILDEDEITDVPALSQEIYLPGAAFLYNDLNTILKERLQNAPDWRIYCSGIVKSLLCKILRACTATSNIIDPKAGRILAYIHENYASPLDNATIAAQLGYHPYYVNRIISANVGMTIHEYVNHYRLLMASHYLSTTNIPISQICNLVGFQNPSHFTGNFKKKFGVSPKDYRRMSANDYGLSEA